jgi:hypothetical protein
MVIFFRGLSNELLGATFWAVRVADIHTIPRAIKLTTTSKCDDSPGSHAIANFDFELLICSHSGGGDTFISIWDSIIIAYQLPIVVPRFLRRKTGIFFCFFVEIKIVSVYGINEIRCFLWSRGGLWSRFWLRLGITSALVVDANSHTVTVTVIVANPT